MGTVRKTTRSTQKKQSLKQNDVFKEIGTKILRTVMTVGFAMSSFIAQDVEAAGNGIVRVDGTTNLMQNGVANIYAEQVSGQVGLNRFQYFDVGSGQTANLYFNQAGSTNYVNTLVNTVQNRIDIGGTVNAIRNNKISGNLYFLSPQGMVIGAGGVVNAGSLTILTPTQEAFSQYNSVANLDFINTAGVRNDVAIPINASGTIEVHGTINAATAVELQAGKIDVSKAADSSINPVIKTGVVFGNIVNNSAVINTSQKLQAQVDANGNVTFTDGTITGDGSIKVLATADKINDDTNKQVVASVNVGHSTTIEAVGDVVIKANANHEINVTKSTPSVSTHTANTKAEITIDGKVTGKNVDVQANATSTFNTTGINGIEQFFGGVIENVADMMPDKIGNVLKDKTNSFTKNIDLNLLKQTNFSYGGADAEAIITINEHAYIQAVGVNNNSALIGGDVNVNAESYTLTNIKGALLPTKSKNDGSTSNIDNPYLTLGIVYQENNSNSRVNVKGKIVSYNNLYIGSEAKAENDLALAIKKGNNLTADDAYIKAVIGIINQNAKAEVNVGVEDNESTGNLLQASGDLDIKSDTETKINSTVGVQADLDSMLNTAINIVGGDVSSKININDAIQGGNVNITANHLSNGFQITTNNAFAETDGDFVNINNTGAKTNAISNNIKKVKNFVQGFINKKNNSNNTSNAWDQYFDLGASITIDDIANNAEVNINPAADIKATGVNGSDNAPALNINAAIKIADKQIKTTSILGNKKATSALGIGAAVVIDNLTNNANVNITSDTEKPQLISEAGNIVIASKIDDSYKRFDNMSFTQKINPTNYPNVYVYSGVVKDIEDVVVATGTVGIQNINNNSNVNIGAGAVISANNKVDISATSIVGNALGAGKVGLPSNYNSNGIGGSVGVQNTNTNSKVTIANDVQIIGGQIDINANNDVKNVGVVISGTKTSSLGITGMVSYMGGTSNAEVAVDDDADLTATKVVTQDEGVDVVTKAGQININSENDTTLTNVVGDVTSSGGIGLDASVGVISYDVHSFAQVKNIETTDTYGKGVFSANSFTTEALTDGTINNITVAGTKVGGSKPEKSGSNVTVRDNNNNQAGSSNNTTNLQNATVSSNGVSNGVSASGKAQNNSSIKISEAGSVSWNDIHNKTIAAVDGVEINLTTPENATDKTTSLKVQAVDQSYIGAYSGAMALTQAGNSNNTSFSATLSGAVAVNDLVKETSAKISGSSISNALNIDNIAQNQGAQVAAGLALGLETGNRTNSAGVNVAANGSFNYIDSDVNAVMDGVSLAGNTNNVNVDNIAYDKDVQVAGGITAEYAKSKIVAGASIAVNKATNDINAIIKNSNLGTSISGVNNLAVSKLTQVGSAVSVGFTTADQNLGILEAAVAVNNVSNNVNATVEDSNVYAKTIANKAFDGEVSTGITTHDYLEELADQGFDVNGTDALANANVNSLYSNSQPVTTNSGNLIVGAALGLGAKLANGSYSGAGGAGVVINNVNNDFVAKVSGGTLSVAGDNSNLNVEAIADTKMIGVATGIAAASGSNLTIAGSGVTQTIHNDTKALIDGTTITATDMFVEAESKSNLISVAGQVSAGHNANAAVGAAVSIVNSDFDTSATINNATINAQDVIVQAISNNESMNVAIGLSVAAGSNASLSGAGNVATNNIANDTTVTIAGTTIDASGTVAALANSSEVLRNYGGAASVSANSGASIALGGTVVVNTITGNTNAIVQNSNIVALGVAGNGVNVKDYDISKDAPASSASNSSTTSSINGADVAEKMLQDKGTHSVTGSDSTKTGFVVNADAKHTLRDISVTAGVAASTSGVAGALDATVAVNTINGKTSAEVNNTNINNIGDLTGINNSANVFVNAYDKVDMQSQIGTLSVGGAATIGAGAATAVDVNNINRETTAKIVGVAGTDLNKNIVNGYDIDVNALGETDITITESGLAVGAGATGGGAVTGSVSVNHFTGLTNAMVSGIISNAHQLNVEANRVADIQIYNNGAAASGGEIAGAIGVGVTYVKDESSTSANLNNSSIERIGSVAGSTVSVQADNKSSISTEAGSGALAIGIGGAVGTSIGVANMNNTTSVTISNTTVGKHNSFDNVDVKADNLLSSNFTNWAAGGGLGGIGVGVGVNTVNSGVSTNVIDSEVYANDIDVVAREIRNIKEVAVGATVGAVGIGVNVLNTNIGTAFADSFNYNLDDDASKDNYSTAGIVNAVNGALDKATNTIDALQAKHNTSNISDNSIRTIDRGYTDGGVQTTIQNSVLHASNELEIFNEATTNADIFAFQGTAGIVGVNVSVGVVDVESDLGITLNNANLKGDVVEIYSENDGDIHATTFQAGVGGGAINVGYGSVTNGGNNQITIDGSTVKATDATSNIDDLNIYAVNAVDVENTVRGFEFGGVAGGAFISKAIDASNTKVDLGETAGNTFIGSAICIEAYNDPHMKAVIDAFDIGALSGKGNNATAKASGKTTLNVDAKNSFDANEVELVAKSGEYKDDEISTSQTGPEKVTTEANVLGGAPAIVGVIVNKARTYNEMETTLNVGAANFYKTIVEDNLKTSQDETNIQSGITNLIIGVVNSTDSFANIDEGSRTGGGVTSGSNFAQTNANSKVTLNIDAGDKLHVNTLELYATNNETIKAIANGTNGSLVNVSPYAAKVENNITATTNLNVVGNIETEDYFIAQALGKTTANLKADAMNASVVGGSGTAVDSVITTTSNVNIGNGTKQANITTGGDTVVEAENTINLNRADGFDKMVLGNGYGGVTASVAHIDNTVNSNAKVNLNSTNILSAGEVDLIAHTNEDLRVNGYVYSTGVLNDSNNQVTNKVNNNENIVLNNSKIRLTEADSDLTISAADDLKLFTYSLSETRIAVLGVTTSFVDNILNRNNKISLTGDSDIFSMQDINLFAGKLVDGNLAKFDLDAEATAFNGSIIPIPINPKVTNNINQSNVVEIGSSSESTSVRHTNIYADKGLEISRIGAGAYNNYSSSQKTDIVTSLAGQVIKGKTENNHVKIDGRAVAGVASNIKITIGEAGEIIILNADERNFVSGAKGNPTIDIDADESVGLTADSLKLGTEDYANALFNRYVELQVLMSEYAKDGTNSKAYLGYSAEADRIANMMVGMGLAEKDSTTHELKMQNSLSVDYIEIPDIEASGGNITIDTGDFYGSGNVEAKGTREVSITNNTNLLLKVNSIVIDEAGGKLVYNGNVLDSTYSDVTDKTVDLKKQINAINSNVKNVGFNKVTAETNSGVGINIQGTHTGNIQYSGSVTINGNTQTVSQSIRPLANIQIQGDIINREGSVNISSAQDDIVIQGKSASDSVAISGTIVNLSASQGSIAQGYTDGIVNIGGSVKDQYANEINGTQTGVNGTVTDRVNTPANGSAASGSYIAGGSVYINAADINVNGIIQSGYADYNVTIDDTAQNRISAIENNYDGTREISDSTVTTGDSYKIVDGGAYWNATSGCYEYRLNAYYNPATKKIILEDVDANGGKVYLTGRISSTGNGQIICLDGVSDVTINNSLNYDMKLGEVVVNDVDGLVSIKDTAKNTLTEISKGQVTVNTINANGSVSNNGTTTSFVGNYNYDPLANLRYEWTTGTDTTTYTRYKYEEIKALWGLWKPSATTEELAQWITNNLATQIESGTGTDVPRKEGEVIVIGSSANNSSYSQTISNNTYSSANIKESERYWSTGFLGFNKHHEVIWTQSSGTVTTVHHSVKADNPINVKFIGNTADSSQITVNTAGNLELTGNVGNTKLYDIGTVENPSQNYLGNIDITVQNGSIIQTGGNLIGSNIELAAGEDIRDIDILAGDVVNVSAVNLMTAATDNVHLHSIGLNVKQAHGTKGNVVLGDVGSFRTDGSGNYSTGVTANVNITAVGDISQNADKVVAANRIDLATKGSITDLNVYAGQQPIGLDTLDASVNATAKGDIKLKQVDGDMRIGRIYSKSGDVTITVADGSIIDDLPYVSQERGEIDEMLARWESLGIIESSDGTDTSGLIAVKSEIDNANYEAWDKNALLYAIEDSIVNPDSNTLHNTSSKDPNIIGHNITLNVKDSAGLFGDDSKEVNITTLFDKKQDGTYVNNNSLNDLRALSKADASTVSWKTNDDGDKIAVINEVLPVGIQQTVKTVVEGDKTENVYGKLVVESTNSNDSDSFGDIFLEGRNEKDIDNLFVNPGNTTNDLFVGQLVTNSGDVHLSSLGSIINSANAGQVAIQANNLTVFAANGSIGTVGHKLTIQLDGFQGTLSNGTSTIKEGTLSAVASGGIYVDQKVYDLAINNISSGGDIDLSADKSIFMEIVNGTDAVNYIRAENNGNITLEARHGSLGKSSTGGRNTNNGIRVLNDSGFATSANDENVTIVTLKASDDIYVTGVASSDGQTVVQNGPAGVLNLVVERYNKYATAEVAPLNNIGISVDGKLNLLSDLESTDKVSVYTSDTLEFNDNVSAKDVYISSGNDVNLQSGGITALDAYITAQNGSIIETYDNEQSEVNGFTLNVSNSLETVANSGIDLGSKFNQLKNVSLKTNKGALILGNGAQNNTALNVSVLKGTNLSDSITIHNYDSSQNVDDENAVIISGDLKSSGDIRITNDESSVIINANQLFGRDVILNAETHVVNNSGLEAIEDVILLADSYVYNNGDVEAGEDVTFTAEFGFVSNTGTIKGEDVTFFAESNIANEAGITAEKAVEFIANSSVTNNGAVIAREEVTFEATTGKVANSGAIEGASVEFIAGTDIVNEAGVAANKGVNFTATNHVTNSGKVTAEETVSFTAQGGYIINKGEVSGEEVAFTAASNIVNEAGITAGKVVNFVAGNSLTNGGSITAKEDVSLKATTGKVANSGAIEGARVEFIAGTDIVNASDIVANEGVNFTAASNVTNSGKVDVVENVSFTAKGGYIINKGEVSGEEVAFDAATNIANEAGITAGKVVNFVAGNSLTNGGSITAKEDVSLKATTGKVANSGAIEGASVEFMAGTDIFNEAGIVANKGVTFTAASNVTNSGKVTAEETARFTAKDGYIINQGEVSGEEVAFTAASNIANEAGITAYKVVNFVAGNSLTNGGRITAKEDVSFKTTTGKVTNSGAIEGASVEFMAGTDIVNEADIVAIKGVNFTAASNVTNSGKVNAAENVSFTAQDGYIINKGEVRGEKVAFAAASNIVNEAGITAGKVVNFVAGNSLTNGGSITAKEDVSLKATTGKVANSGVIEGASVEFMAGTDIFNEAGIVANKGVNFTADSNVTNSGKVDAAENVIFIAQGGYIINQGEVSGEEVAFTAASNIANEAGITAYKVVNFVAGNSLTNGGRITAKEDVSFSATTGKVTNSGAIEGASVELMAGTDIVNEADIVAIKGVTFTADSNVTNSGKVDAVGDITFIAQKGYLINSGAISGYNVSLLAKDNINNLADIVADSNVILNSKASVTNNSKIHALGGYVDLDATLNVNNEVVADGLGIIADDDIFITAWKGNVSNSGNIYSKNGYVVLDAGFVYDTENNNDTTGVHNVTNTGSIKADNGDVTITSHNGNVHNSADITVQKGNVVISAYQHKGYNGAISSDIGNITNDGSGDIAILGQGNIVLNADNDINNTDDFYTVNGNITIEANGNVVNGDGNGKGVIETEAGNVTITSLNGYVKNLAKADLVSGKGNVTIEAKGDTNNASVENHGDLMALGGTIILKSAHGNVTNTDDFNSLSDVNGNVSDSYFGLYDSDNIGMVISTGNILLSAENGALSNDKNLESAENITLIAGDGLDDFAYHIFAGKDISLTATAGDIVNTSVLESYAGNVNLIAENGSVINGDSSSDSNGDIIALGGSVTLEAKGNTTGNLGHVYNYGDIIAIGDTVNDQAGSGSITLKSHYGNVNNYDDFNVASGSETYSYDDANHGSITSLDASFNLATSNITMSAVNGTIYNDKDYFVALGDITLESKEGIGNSGEMFMAGGNITMSDTDGNLINNAKLISVNGDITLNAEKGQVINESVGDVLALNGNVAFNAKGDVTNHGDVIALNANDKANKGSISFVSSTGNVYNYDDFKLVDGNNYYDYDGSKFNDGTYYDFEKRYILTDSDLTMKALEGYIYNDMAIVSKKNVTLVSGKDLTIGTNVASVESNGDVIVQSLNGNVKLQQDSKVLSNNGDIVIDGYAGIEVVEGSTLQADKGSISVVSTNGEVSVAKMFAGDMANVGSNSGNVVIGEVQGKKVVLFSQGEDAKINADNIKVQDYLVLQGDDVALKEIDRSSNKGTLNVDVSGVNGGTMKCKLSLDLEGDVRFTTANVTDAEVNVSGKLGMDKVHVAGKGHFYSQGYLTGIYGVAPNHDGSNALYFDFGKGYGPTLSTMLGLNAASFTTDNALNAMDSINSKLNEASKSGDTFNKPNNSWMNLYVDSSRVQRSNGALLRIDTHYTSYNQRWSAEDLASKQNDFQANYAYDYHFEDRPVLFNRNNLYDIPETIVVPVIKEQADDNDNSRRKRVLNFEGDKV